MRQFQFHLPPARSLLRLHAPDRFGDDLTATRPAVILANRERRTVTGIEADGAGHGLHAVAPVFVGAAHVGSVELGLGLDAALLRRLTGDAPGALYLNAREGQPGARIAAAHSSAALLAAFDAVPRDTAHHTTDVAGAPFSLLSHPLDDVSGAPVGRVVLALDLTALHAARAQGWWVVTGVAAAVLALVLCIFVITGRQATRLAHSQSRTRFESRLARALQMARDEPQVYAVVDRALAELAPDQPIALMLADNSNAHLQTVLARHLRNDNGPPTPQDCPAARSGQAQAFASAHALDACPRLACGADCAASCHPVAIGGATIGVLTTRRPAGPLDPHLLVRLNLLTHKLGDRLTVLRAMAEKDTQARTDPLTGLLNRRRFTEEAMARIADGAPYAVAYADLDHFKQLNDTYGHAAGDKALRQFAQVLQAACPAPLLASRHGGEEFVVLLPGHTADAARAWGNHLRAQLAARTAQADGPAFTVSIGVALARGDLDATIQAADEALLEAKRTGRDRVSLSGQPRLEHAA